MIKKLNYLEKIEKSKSKREYHLKYNYSKLDEIKSIIIDFEKNKDNFKISLKYDDEILKNSSFYKINENLFILEIENKYIIIRKDEKSFFFNHFILEINEYNKNQEKKKSLIDYMKKISNFIIIDELNFIILDIENDYILKK